MDFIMNFTLSAITYGLATVAGLLFVGGIAILSGGKKKSE